MCIVGHRFPAAATCPVLLLEEPLVLTLQLLLKHNASDRFAAFHVLLGRPHVGAIDPRIMREFAP